VGWIFAHTVQLVFGSLGTVVTGLGMYLYRRHRRRSKSEDDGGHRTLFDLVDNWDERRHEFSLLNRMEAGDRVTVVQADGRRITITKAPGP